MEDKFEDNGIVGAFKILNLYNILSKKVGLANWNMIDLEIIYASTTVSNMRSMIKVWVPL